MTRALEEPNGLYRLFERIGLVPPDFCPHCQARVIWGKTEDGDPICACGFVLYSKIPEVISSKGHGCGYRGGRPPSKARKFTGRW